MHRRTKACNIPPKVKKIVYERDGGLCIFCKGPGDPVAHFVSRSQGGLGIERNIITACAKCHALLDNSEWRADMKDIARDYLKKHYPDWNESELYYKKW